MSYKVPPKPATATGDLYACARRNHYAKNDLSKLYFKPV
jgi:hypothetical protein